MKPIFLTLGSKIFSKAVENNHKGLLILKMSPGSGGKKEIKTLKDQQLSAYSYSAQGSPLLQREIQRK